MAKYMKKPVVIEAVQWNGANLSEVKAFAGDAIKSEIHDEFYNRGEGIPSVPPWIEITIHTLEGHMTAEKGDYIIRGVKGEIYPCKPDIFDATYEPVEAGEGQG